MMKKTLLLCMLMLLPVTLAAYTLSRVSVHDPSVVWDPASQTYYIFGSHRAVAKSTDMIGWTDIKKGKLDNNQLAGVAWKTATNDNAYSKDAFDTPAITKIIKGGKEFSLPNFSARAWAAKGSTRKGKTYDISGNLWAPDVIWNKEMKKWCMYMSVNGDYWYSSIVLLTADNIEGPYEYQAPVVISGFFENNTYKETDLELVIGQQTALPARYAMKSDGAGNWGERYPNSIDPCVFYDEEGKLWMSYGSWSGGIWMLELDEKTGLRDYDVTYEQVGTGNNITVDPYFGKKISGGHYVSGEASYIEYIGGYYFLFVTNGGLEAKGGYQMRVFRSEKPDGPYVDTNNTSALFPKYLLNYGPNSDNRGANLFGAYGDWGYQAKGNYAERSQGHNSIIAAEDGRTYLVYHTRFQNLGEGHQVRVHQVFQNEDGWLVAAPFEYTGEEVKSADIASTQQIATDKIAGGYKLLIHRYRLDHANMELATPIEVSLNTDGTISGAVSGSWKIKEGTSYISISLGSTIYKGVLVEQTMEPGLTKVVSFTAMNNGGVSIWGYKYTETTTPDNQIEATWKYEQNFSSTDGLTIVGDGSFVEDATFGRAYLNGGGAVRGHYLLLPEDVLSHSAETQQMTISFWVNAAHAGSVATYTYAPFFAGYAKAPGTKNESPMLVLQSRGPVQINNNGWCDFTGDNHIDNKVNVYNQNAWEAKDSKYNFVRNWLADNKWHHYAITFKATEVIQYFDGEVSNQWILNPSVDGQNITGLFSQGSALKYICLGGNQAWDWNDADAKFMFAKLLIQNNAMSASDIKARINADVTSGITGIAVDKKTDAPIYDLSGRRVKTVKQGGVYIQNHKKFIAR